MPGSTQAWSGREVVRSAFQSLMPQRHLSQRPSDRGMVLGRACFCVPAPSAVSRLRLRRHCSFAAFAMTFFSRPTVSAGGGPAFGGDCSADGAVLALTGQDQPRAPPSAVSSSRSRDPGPSTFGDGAQSEASSRTSSRRNAPSARPSSRRCWRGRWRSPASAEGPPAADADSPDHAAPPDQSSGFPESRILCIVEGC